MIAWVRALVRVIAHVSCGKARPVLIGDIVQPSPSEGWRSSAAQSIVRPSRRGGVPVLSRVIGRSRARSWRSEEHTSELQSLMRISYAVFCLKQIISRKRNSSNSRATHLCAEQLHIMAFYDYTASPISHHDS